MSDEIKNTTESEVTILQPSKKGFLVRGPAPISSPQSTEDNDEEVDNSVSVSWIKLLSGKFICTVVGAVCFYKFSNTICKIMIAKQENIDTTVVISLLSNLLIIVSNIFTFYFVRKSMQSNGNGGIDNG